MQWTKRIISWKKVRFSKIYVVITDNLCYNFKAKPSREKRMKNKNICRFPMSIIEGNSLTISCFVRETNPNAMKKSRLLDKNRLILCTEGNGVFLINGATVPFTKGAFIFCFKEETIVLQKGENVAYMYIDFDGARANELFRKFDVTPFSRTYIGFDGVIPLWQESLFRSSDKTIELTAESVLLYSFARLSYDKSTENALISEIIQITEENFKDPALSISAIAKELSYNPKYLSHIFKQKSKVTYSEYLRSVRLKFATSLFDHGIDSVKNVAYLSGFSDPLYFSNVFKKCVGISPSEYIERQVINKN